MLLLVKVVYLIFVPCAYINLQVRQLGATSQTECLDLAKTDRMHSFHKVEEVADELDGVYCLPKVSA